MDTWDKFAIWYNLLCEKRNDLSNKMKDEIQKKVAHIDNTSQKIEILYHYLQDKTRYVNLNFGKASKLNKIF